MNPLLTLCARTEYEAIAPEPLRQAAHNFTDWEQLSAEAERQGLGPLLYTHLQAAGAQPPPPVKRTLQGLYLRHRHANRVRAQAMVEILTAYRDVGIEPLLLKGAALAHMLYPQPGLRPMSDLDLLVKTNHARQAQQTLVELGYRAPLPSAGQLPGKHLLAATRQLEGLTVSVEIHHNLFNIGTPASLTLDELTASPFPFALNGLTAYTLPHEEMLWHLCQHLILIGQPFRLIWLADIVGLAERFTTDIDWDRLKHQYPLVLSTLSLFHFITPLSDRLRRSASLKIGRVPQGIGHEFEGWPRTSLKAQQRAGKGIGQIMRDTFWPTEWWLRLYYGQGSTRPLFPVRWGHHPLRILTWAAQLVAKRIAGK